MLGAHVLREAEMPSGNAEAQADSWDVQPASDSFVALCGRSMDLCVQWNVLVTPHVGHFDHLFLPPEGKRKTFSPAPSSWK